MDRWVCGVHDHELLMGAFHHGFGSWAAIFNDPSFSFSRCIAIFETANGTITHLCNACDANPVAAAEQ